MSYYSPNNFRTNPKEEKKKEALKEEKRREGVTKDKEVNALPIWSQTGSDDINAPNKK